MKKFQKVSEITAQDIFDIADRYCDSALLQLAHHQGIFELLQSPKTTEEIAYSKGWITRKTNIVLNALTAIGLLKKRGILYQNSLASNQALVKSSRDYIGDLIEHERLQWQLWEQMDEVLSSKKAIEKQQDLNLPNNSEANAVFHKAMQQLSKVTVNHILNRPELMISGHVLDLAGGHGLYLAQLAHQNSGITGEVWDVPSAREYAENNFLHYGVKNRLSFFELDISNDSNYIGKKADVVMLNHCLHHFEKEAILRILRRVTDLLPIGGTLIIVEVFLEENQIEPVNGALFSLYMMVNTVNGEVHSTQWIIEAIKELGFDVELQHLDNLEDDIMIVGKKK
jgi:2-polyprenyl-3-methyl-5-hydroxy-6-metoxy-1,4-benzoquinol methylase